MSRGHWPAGSCCARRKWEAEEKRDCLLRWEEEGEGSCDVIAYGEGCNRSFVAHSSVCQFNLAEPLIILYLAVI